MYLCLLLLAVSVCVLSIVLYVCMLLLSGSVFVLSIITYVCMLLLAGSVCVLSIVMYVCMLLLSGSVCVLLCYACVTRQQRDRLGKANWKLMGRDGRMPKCRRRKKNIFKT